MTTPTIAYAQLGDVRPNGLVLQHGWDDSRVCSIVAHVRAHDGTWDLPPILILDDVDPVVLDGHHRVLAAQDLGLARIPAWIVPLADYTRLVEERYYGYAPTRTADLDPYIDCGGRSYDDLGYRRSQGEEAQP